MNWQSELDLAVSATQAAAALLLESFSTEAGIQSLAGKDIKTRADVEAEACIVKRLSVSGIPVLGEEVAKTEARGLRWLVDPLDGTMNFSRGFPMNAVSVGLWDEDRPILGAVYDLPRRRLYSGCVGTGAWCEGKPIQVSAIKDCSQAVLATGFPVNRDYGQESLGRFIKQVQGFKKVRMIGSAVLSLAYVAQGVFDAYFEEDIMLWDVAAGLALVAAAGGQVQTRPGNMADSVVAKASNGKLNF